MNVDEIIELAIQGHASTRDAIRWAMSQEREAVARIVEKADLSHLASSTKNHWGGCMSCGFTPKIAAESIRTRGGQK